MSNEAHHPMSPSTINPAVIEAVSQADAHLNNVGLPGYAELVTVLTRMVGSFDPGTCFDEINDARAFLARIPSPSALGVGK